MIQAYIQYPELERMPLKELKGYKKIHLKAGEESSVSFSIPLNELLKWDIHKKKWQLYPGNYSIFIGPNSAEQKAVSTFVAKN